MNLNNYNKLKAIADKVHFDFLNFSSYYTISEIDSLWKGAVHLNKKQNSLLKEGEGYETVCFYPDGERWREIKANSAYSRMDYFIIELCRSNCVDYTLLIDILKTTKN